MKISLLYVTHPDDLHAQETVNTMVREKLVACGNTFPITACYIYEGEFTNEGEVVTILKTSNKLWKKARDRVVELHDYKTPCVLRFKVSVNPSYGDWIHQTLENKS